MQQTFLVLVLAVATGFSSVPQAAELDPMAARIQTQMRSSDRHEYDLPRDPHRKPYETFQFLGLNAGMTVMDVAAYAGYTTEMLAAAVGVDGVVYSQNTQRVLERYADGYYQRTMDERLANNRLPNVVLHIHEYEDLGLEGQLDLAFLGNMLHDFYNFEGEEVTLSYLRSIRKALKPGGVLGVTDHVGTAGLNNTDLHRMEPDQARALLEKVGFVIEAESDLFANPKDGHNLQVYEESIYRRTDRFLFRARKL